MNGTIQKPVVRAMKATVFVLVLCSTASFAATLVTSSIDGGGQRATSASYTMDGSVGSIAGISSATPDTARHGYLGQLTEVASLSVTGAPAVINQGATSQLTGTATMDDDTITTLAGSDIAWDALTYPFQSVDSSGLLTALANVYAAPVGNVYGSYLGASSNASVQVLGPYANGGIPDSWLVQYFGSPPNPNAAPTVDPDGDGQNNLFEYVADLVPTNPASVFVLRIQPVTGQPAQKRLLFDPVAVGRTYTPEYRTNLVSGSYGPLTGYAGPTTNLTEVTVTDLNATEASKFYRVRITYP